jgi:ribosomal protein L29
MKKKSFSDIQNMSIQDIKESIVDRRRALFQLRMSSGSDGFRSSDVSLSKKDIARFKTALSEKFRKEAKH